MRVKLGALRLDALQWRDWLIGLGTASSLLYAHGPLVSFAAIAGTTLPRTQALGVTLWIWLVNQLSGYGLRQYPISTESLLWGLTMGLGSLAVVLIATLFPRPAGWGGRALGLSGAFLLGFGVYQSSILGLNHWIGMHGLTLAVFAHLLIRDTIWLLLLLGCYMLCDWSRNRLARRSTP